MENEKGKTMNEYVRVKIFEASTSRGLQDKINDYFDRNKICVIEIKYQVTRTEKGYLYSALFFYQAEE